MSNCVQATIYHTEQEGDKTRWTSRQARQESHGPRKNSERKAKKLFTLVHTVEAVELRHVTSGDPGSLLRVATAEISFSICSG